MECNAQLDSDLLAHDGSEAIFREKYLILRVRVTDIRASHRYVGLKITSISPEAGAEWGTTIGCCREYFYGGKFVWLSGGYVFWRVFFASDVIADVLRIRAGFPKSDKFEHYDRPLSCSPRATPPCID